MVPLATCCLSGDLAQQSPEHVVFRVYPLPWVYWNHHLTEKIPPKSWSERAYGQNIQTKWLVGSRGLQVIHSPFCV